ncbi:L-aminoadipate-semialdehyde dehydrogenase [Rhodotorula diobovata]|uniref:L-aminoadipate-semialdehyde dehydrogenase n=1 Tax=Rhodotorula diobovata TaxID=5288 RepID=A0A5C5FPP4_9BASI|nr:L-aminoadipate-semialdehyde dehydrogenase [Rhodotorula diobovata]
MWAPPLGCARAGRRPTNSPRAARSSPRRLHGSGRRRDAPPAGVDAAFSCSFARHQLPHASLDTTPCFYVLPTPLASLLIMPVARADLYGETFASVNEVLPARAASHPDVPILGVPGKDGVVRTYTYSELERATNLLAYHLASVVPPRAKGDATTKMTCALLAPSGYDYAINEMALVRIGYAVLLVSPNNSPAAIAHLCTATKASVLFTAPAYVQNAQEAQALATEHSFEVLDLAPSAVYSDKAIAAFSGVPYPVALSPADEGALTAFIVHSSGSTGHPKPIYISGASTAFNIATHFGLSGLTTLPLYHNHGHSCFWRALYSVRPLWLYPASELPLTTPNVMSILDQPSVQPEALFGVPYVYKLLGETEAGIETLRKFKLCLFGGSAMPTELGDRLVEAGVRLVGHYGATEVGQLMTSFRDYETDKEWAYNRVPPALAPYFKLEEHGPGVFEVVVLDGWRGKVVSNRPDGSYATSDLFVKHPELDAYKFVGRVDDTLVLVTGEKVNPVPIELTLRGESPYIKDAIVFGVERSQTGALVILSDTVNPATPRSELVKLVGPAVELANSEAPSHSRLTEEMLVFLPADTAIPRADKGSFIRRKVYAEFKDVIDCAYSDLEGGSGGSRAVGALGEMRSHIRELIASIAKSSDGLEDDTDLFSYGLDSLAATRIRNALQREFDLAGQKLPMNFVFEQPTIEKMSAYLVALAKGESVTERTQVEQMGDLVDKYRRFFEVPSTLSPDATSRPSASVVLLSGATGSLGANQLAQLLSTAEVKKVYTLVRARDDAEAAERVAASLNEKGLAGAGDARIVALAADFSQDRLGLSEERFEEVKADVTVVLHYAWSVNFNLSIASFEPHIRGACNLIQLCLSSRHLAFFFFASSVSAVAAYSGPSDVPEAVTDDPHSAQQMGYARSKWVTEKLCQIASETTPVRAVVLRVGQMVGSTVDGRWNETEAVSLMIKTGDTLHALPELQETPSWLPVDYAASTIFDLVKSEPPAPRTSQCWHVLQPRLVPFSDVLDALESTGMTFERVSPPEWVERLRKGPQDPVANPAIKLLSFFESKYASKPVAAVATDAAPAPRRSLSCTKTLAVSQSLRDAPVVGKDLMAKYVDAWRKSGFLAPPVKA